MKYSDEQRISKINTLTESLLFYLKSENIDREKVSTIEHVKWAVTTPLYNIGEHAYNLSKEYKESHSEIPWAKISGLRHRLVHDYEDTNWDIICDILFDVLPTFKKQINSLHS